MATPQETDFRDMAMDALKNLVNNVPDWLKRLNDLSGQIDRRQAELAAVAAAEGKSAETKSLRNKGSTESLKPKDDPAVVHAEAPANENILGDGAGDKTAHTPVKSEIPKLHTPNPALIRQLPNTAKKRKFDELAVKQDVYYDSYGPSFFDELVKFISSSGNQLRKLKAAARVAGAKKLAEQDVSEDGSDLTSRPGSKNQPPDVYNDLRKGLKSVQSMCNDGAEQLLRKGHCSKEIKQVQRGLTKVLKMAETEMERGEPESAEETSEITKVHMGQTIVVRRGNVAGTEESKTTPTEEQSELDPQLETMGHITVDPRYNGTDEGIDL
ncbi:hypothetical protein IWW34DRAFT_674405 [Fusarium oxysporum f. sp. albedinis]|nr:hypothetical protein IWW34DRAFT_674405 [Fusarium oxysporum f. sp. albedinis]KAK2470706.1 hypothetical protein H9L39_16937 [Fusarium oxysporum f. sp. albedinis]